MNKRQIRQIHELAIQLAATTRTLLSECRASDGARMADPLILETQIGKQLDQLTKLRTNCTFVLAKTQI